MLYMDLLQSEPHMGEPALIAILDPAILIGRPHHLWNRIGKGSEAAFPLIYFSLERRWFSGWFDMFFCMFGYLHMHK